LPAGPVFATLIARGWLVLDVAGPVYLHPVLAAYLRQYAPDPSLPVVLDATLSQAVEAEAERSFPAIASPYQRQLAAVVHRTGRQGDAVAAEWLHRWALVLIHQGNWEAAREAAEQALAVLESADHQRLLARICGALGDRATAEALYHQVLAQDGVGAAAGLAAARRFGLAHELHAQGFPSLARPLYEALVAEAQAQTGPESLHTAFRLSELAEVIAASGDPIGARALHAQALAMRERLLGPDAPAVAFSLGALAALNQADGVLESARALYERALAIYETALHPDGPDAIACRMRLADVLQALGNYPAAWAQADQIRAHYEKFYGPYHQEAVAAVRRLALIAQAAGDVATARTLYHQMVTQAERAFWPGHPTLTQYRAEQTALERAEPAPGGYPL
jgi:tetratricopeptide (TPR) repeat protein